MFFGWGSCSIPHPGCTRTGSGSLDCENENVILKSKAVQIIDDDDDTDYFELPTERDVENDHHDPPKTFYVRDTGSSAPNRVLLKTEKLPSDNGIPEEASQITQITRFMVNLGLAHAKHNPNDPVIVNYKNFRSSQSTKASEHSFPAPPHN